MLHGPTNLHLSVIGKFIGILSIKSTECEQEIFIVKTNLLGLSATIELQLIEQLHSMCSSPESVKQLFPDLFTGLGTLGVEYEIKLLPYALMQFSLPSTYPTTKESGERVTPYAVYGSNFTSW